MGIIDGRGRYSRWNTKALLCELLWLDMRDFAKSVDLTTVRYGCWAWTAAHGRESSISYQVKPGEGIRLMYTNNKTDELDYLVRITSTPCNYGGVRYWWLCPNGHCGRRCRVLYGGKYFVCRQCNSHAYYETQRDKNLLTRIDNELTAIRRKLKAKKTLAVTSSLPARPKGMHFRTFLRLAQRYNDLQYYRVLSIGIDIAKLGEVMGIRSAGSAADMEYQLKWLIQHEDA